MSSLINIVIISELTCHVEVPTCTKNALIEGGRNRGNGGMYI